MMDKVLILVIITRFLIQIWDKFLAKMIKLLRINNKVKVQIKGKMSQNKRKIYKPKMLQE